MTANSIKVLALTSLLGGLALAAHTEEASAKSIMSCKGNTRQSVIDCCEDLVRRKGVPYWMRQGDLNCKSATVCTKSGGTFAAAVVKKKCYISTVGKDVTKHVPPVKKGR